MSIQREKVEIRVNWVTSEVSFGEDVCSICLEEGVSVLLPCGHAFHKVCILHSVKYKVKCPLCRSQCFTPTRVYCEECFSNYFEGPLLQLTSKLDILSVSC